MRRRYPDIKIGDRFGRLTVVSDAPKRGNEKIWNCKCDCGNITSVLDNNLKRDHTKSCGRCRNRFENRFEIINDEIKVYTSKDKHFFILSKESFWVLRDYCWVSSLSNGNLYISAHMKGAYKQAGNKYRSIFLHRILMKEELLKPENKGKVVDHINGNSLDNRLCNLRVVTCSRNSLNKKRKEDYGVYERKTKAGLSWTCIINVKRKYNYIGTFHSKELAIQARDKWELEHNRLDYFREADKDRSDYYSKILGPPKEEI